MSKTIRMGVTGGTGFIGQALIAEALRRNFDIVALQRRASVPGCDGATYNVVPFDLSDPQALDATVLKNLDVMVHAAALVHTSDNAEDHHIRLNFEATRVLYDTCVKAGVGTFVFLSTIAVYGVNGSQVPLTRQTPVGPTSSYGLSKRMAEEYLLQQHGTLTSHGTLTPHGASTKVVILRLPLVYGPGAPGNYGLIAKLSQTGLPLPFRDVTNKRSLIHVEALAALIADRAEHKITGDGVHLVAEDRCLSTENIITHECAKSGKRCRLFYVPKALMKGVLCALGKKKMYDSLYEDLVVESTLPVPRFSEHVRVS